MKRGIIILALVSGGVAALLLFGRALKTPPDQIRASIHFVGFTNALLGTNEPMLTLVGRTQPAALQQWLANGTNAAVFTITNHESCTLLIAAHGQVLARGNPVLQQTYLLHPAGFPEFFL